MTTIESQLDHLNVDETVRVYFRRLFATAPNAAELEHTLRTHPRLIEQLAILFASSQFLGEIILQHPEYIPRLARREELARPHTVAELLRALAPHLESTTSLEEHMRVLRNFQRWHLLRIGANDMWDSWNLDRVTRQLSDLAEALIRASLDIARRHSGIPARGFIVLALGKLGGRELNYSSDIDLLFLAQDHPDRYIPLATQLIHILTHLTPEGFLYRVDMRLRPWGRTGPLVTSISGYLNYLRRHARLWERQALLKARPIAGDRALGAALIRRLPPLIFVLPPEDIRAHVHDMKTRIEAHLRQRGHTWGEVKLGEGSIRDIEFIVQYLQLRHGARHPGVRTGNTRKALARLHRLGLIPADEYRILNEGYTFLRTVEHHLQLMHYQQTHRLPDDPHRREQLARRLGYSGPDAAAAFIQRYEEHRRAIRDIYRRYLTPTPASEQRSALPLYRRHIARMAPSYVDAFSETSIREHARLASRLTPEHPVHVRARPIGEHRWEVTIVAYDYLGELSLITGLLFIHGFNIIEGHVFTYERDPAREERPKIVDVFIVQPIERENVEGRWEAYARDLRDLLRRLHRGAREDVQGEIATRFAHALTRHPEITDILYPVDIDIDNTASERYTLLRIHATDTVGFLYEFTNALALQDIYIARVTVRTQGTWVEDILWITDRQGRKIDDPQRQQELRALTVLVKHFTHLLPRAPDPKAALIHFRQFLGELLRRPHWLDDLTSLQRPAVLRTLAHLLGVSEFLWNDFLRLQYEHLFPLLQEADTRIHRKSKATLWFDLQSSLQHLQGAAARDALNAFKDREMFRIDMRYILGDTDIDGFAEELSDLAEVVIHAAVDRIYRELVAQHGEPTLADGTPCPFTVCALGKLGGREMGFASDVELMFIYKGGGRTRGPRPISNARFFERLVREFLNTVRAKREGVFEIDLQLRPYGKAGSLAVPLRLFETYFQPGGPAWPYERQALLRLRAIAGDEAFGREVEALRDSLIYTGAPFDVDAMRAMRERQLRHLVKGGHINAKYSPGGLVDIEYLVQALQLTYGSPYPELRTPNTSEALTRLAQLGILDREDARRLRQAHRFLRRLIEALRVVRGQARDVTVPPPDSEAFLFLARRMGYGDDTAALRRDLEEHMNFVLALQERIL